MTTRQINITSTLNGATVRQAITMLTNILFIVSRELGVDPALEVLESPHPEAGTYLSFRCDNFDKYERIVHAMLDYGILYNPVQPELGGIEYE